MVVSNYLFSVLIVSVVSFLLFPHVYQVLTWLEANCRVAVARANDKDPLNTDFRAK